MTKELELQRLRRDVATKTSQISCMQESLNSMKNELDSKTEMGKLQCSCSLALFFAEKSLNIIISAGFSNILLFSVFSSWPIQVVDLEEALHHCEADKLISIHQVQVLEGQLQAVRSELTDTLEKLQELRNVLQRTQTIADERKASMEKLTVQLR